MILLCSPLSDGEPLRGHATAIFRTCKHISEEARHIQYRKLFTQVRLRCPSQPSHTPPFLHIVLENKLKLSLGLLAHSCGAQLHFHTYYGAILDATLEVGSLRRTQYTDVCFLIALATLPLLIAVLSISLTNAGPQVRDSSHLWLSLRTKRPPVDNRSIDALLKPWKGIQYAQPFFLNHHNGAERLRPPLIQHLGGRLRIDITSLNLSILLDAWKEIVANTRKAMIPRSADAGPRSNATDIGPSQELLLEADKFQDMLVSRGDVLGAPLVIPGYSISRTDQQTIAQLCREHVIVGAWHRVIASQLCGEGTQFKDPRFFAFARHSNLSKNDTAYVRLYLPCQILKARLLDWPQSEASRAVWTLERLEVTKSALFQQELEWAVRLGRNYRWQKYVDWLDFVLKGLGRPDISRSQPSMIEIDRNLQT